MYTTEKELQIKSRTTGFASPAESYVDNSLCLRSSRHHGRIYRQYLCDVYIYLL